MVYQSTRSILRRGKLAPHKKLGQNFLVHRHTAEKIIDLANPAPEDTIVEVGVGFGALTMILAQRVRRVIGFEIDAGIVAWHERKKDLAGNVCLRHDDILRADLGELAAEAGRLKIIANLPYSISSPFLFRLLDNSSRVDWAVVMLQREVAARLMAEPGTREYGAPTVLLRCCATVRPLLTIKPQEFHPRPKVDSMVIRLSFSPPAQRGIDLPDADLRLFRRVVNGAFGQRRKTLLNALHGARIGGGKEELAAAIDRAGISPATRAEKLSLEDFVLLTRSIRNM